MEQRLTKLKNGCYKGDTEAIYRLLEVDRQYKQKKAPIYYLQEIRGGKARYISGVFNTKSENILSFDIKDSIGVKKFYKIHVRDNGDTLEISKGKA